MPDSATSHRPAAGPTAALFVFVLAAGALPTPAALGQNALGDGRGLEKRDAAKYPDQTTRRRSFADELKFRNAIVTGNAAGGMSFRGSVGYSDPTDFRGALGSDDVFDFRRDSLYSGLAGMGLRGTDALQYQFALTTGAAAPQGFLGAPEVVKNERFTAARRDEDELRRGMLRSTSSYTAARPLQPLSLGMRRMRDGRSEAISASPLLGIRTSDLGFVIERGAPREDETAKAAAAALAGQASRSAAPASATTPVRSEPSPDDPPSAASGSRRTASDVLGDRFSSWEKLREDAAASPKPDPTLASMTWQDRIARLRAALAEDADEAAESPELLEESTIQMLRQSGKLDRYIEAESVGADPYAAALLAGQRRMELRAYFDAEERFSRALTIRPADPTAMAGRLHAQIGAGMIASAAINIRSIFIIRPELAGVRYAPSMLPAIDRLQSLADLLSRRIDDERKAKDGLQPTPETALLLAYLGFHLDDPAMVRKGLDRLDEIPDLDGLQRRLAKVLRAVWLDEGAPAPVRPAPPDAAPPAPAPVPEK